MNLQRGAYNYKTLHYNTLPYCGMSPWFIGSKNSGDGVQNLVPRVPYGAPHLDGHFSLYIGNWLTLRVQGRYGWARGWALSDNLGTYGVF